MKRKTLCHSTWWYETGMHPGSKFSYSVMKKILTDETYEHFLKILMIIFVIFYKYLLQ